MEIRFVHRTCSGVVVNFCLGRTSPHSLHFLSLPRSHSFVFFAVHKTNRIFLGPFSCQTIVFKNRTRYRDAKCVEGKGEWGGDISPLVHQEIMRSVPTPQPGPVRRPRTKKITTLAHFAPEKPLLVNKILSSVVKCRVVELLK